VKQSSQPHHWETLVHNWRHVGSPLRPCPQDCSHYATLIELEPRRQVNALILGVTPELFNLPWPDRRTIRSVDRSREMIKRLWPGAAGSASQADWLDMPFPPESFDDILCDGGLQLLRYPDSQRRLAAVLANILKPQGQFTIRLFSKPAQSEEPDAVFSDLRLGHILNAHILKVRLGMALQRSVEEGIVVGKIFDAIMGNFKGLESLHRVTGWPKDEVLTLTSYEHSRDCYHFMTTEQSISVLETGGFLAFERRMENHYPLGERCPVLLFRKKMILSP
jgi:SAM-dependent methyltransferase